MLQSEVKELWCGVSILHSFEPCENSMDWVLGTHGIAIDFQVFESTSKNGEQSKVKFHGSAIFLPSVAPEQGWTKEQTIAQLVRKV